MAIGDETQPATRRDDVLVDAARSGDRAALEQLLRLHHDRVHALCRRMLGDESDAQDATQDALIAAVRALDRFDGLSSFATWVFRIATNTCLDELRRRKRRPIPGLDEASADTRAIDGSPATLRTGVARGRDPADIAIGRVDLDAALSSLPRDFRVAVVLRDVCDLAYDEMAGILGIPVGTVRSRIARGRAALADLLGNFPASSDVEKDRARQSRPLELENQDND